MNGARLWESLRSRGIELGLGGGEVVSDFVPGTLTDSDREWIRWFMDPWPLQEPGRIDRSGSPIQREASSPAVGPACGVPYNREGSLLIRKLFNITR